MKRIFLILVLCLAPSLSLGSSDPYNQFRSQCNKVVLHEVFPKGVPNSGPQSMSEVCNEIINEASMHQYSQNMSGKDFKARMKCSVGLDLVVAAQVADLGPDFIVAPIVRKARSACKSACNDMAKFCPSMLNICEASDVGRWIDILKRDNHCDEFK